MTYPKLRKVEGPCLLLVEGFGLLRLRGGAVALIGKYSRLEELNDWCEEQ